MAPLSDWRFFGEVKMEALIEFVDQTRYFATGADLKNIIGTSNNTDENSPITTFSLLRDLINELAGLQATPQFESRARWRWI
jgi:hypothetical protein